MKLSTTIHEMTHAIGQMHEQSRNDRDNYVTMLWSNIQGGTSNFNMAKANTHDNNPYDYESVLQYSLTVVLFNVIVHVIQNDLQVSLFTVTVLQYSLTVS